MQKLPVSITLTHWGWDKMYTVLRMTFQFFFKFHRSLFLKAQLTINNIGSDNCLAQIRRQAIIWTNDGWIYQCIYASLGLEELNKYYKCYLIDYKQKWFYVTKVTFLKTQQKVKGTIRKLGIHNNSASINLGILHCSVSIFVCNKRDQLNCPGRQYICP